MLQTVTIIAAVITAVSGLVVTLPQMVKAIRRKGAPGVSLPGWVNSCISYTTMVLYLAMTGQVPLLLGCLAGMLVCTATTAVIVCNASSYKDRAWWSTAMMFAATTAALVAYRLGFPAPISALLACSPLWCYGPSAWKAWRSRDVSGISAGTWGLSLVCAISFAVAGYANPVTVANGFVAGTLSVVILARLWVGDRYRGPKTRPDTSE